MSCVHVHVARVEVGLVAGLMRSSDLQITLDHLWRIDV